MSLLIPPYGKVLIAYQQESIRLDFPIYIFVGRYAKEQAIAHKKTGTLCSFLPYGDLYEKYNWPIKNQKVIVVDTGFTVEIMLHKLCFHLLDTYLPRVIFLHSETYLNEIFLPQGETYNG